MLMQLSIMLTLGFGQSWHKVYLLSVFFKSDLLSGDRIFPLLSNLGRVIVDSSYLVYSVHPSVELCQWFENTYQICITSVSKIIFKRLLEIFGVT